MCGIRKPRRYAAERICDKKNGPLSTPIYQTSTFEVTDIGAATRRHPYRHVLHAVWQSDPYSRRNRRSRNSRARIAALSLRLRHVGDHDLDAGAAEERRPHRRPARYLRRGNEVPDAVAAEAGRRNHTGRYNRLRAARARDSPQYEDAVSGIADQSDAAGRRSKKVAALAKRTRADHDDRQHILDAHQLPPSGVSGSIWSCTPGPNISRATRT